jgi:transcriptional regulator with XRE-family HTH domain
MKVKGNLIREARLRKGIKQDVLADILGISQSQYSKLENDEVIFDVQKLGLLMDQLDINPLDVIEFSDKQQLFIHSAMSGNNNNYSFHNYDEEMIRKIVQEELGKNDTKE